MIQEGRLGIDFPLTTASVYEDNVVFAGDDGGLAAVGPQEVRGGEYLFRTAVGDDFAIEQEYTIKPFGSEVQVMSGDNNGDPVSAQSAKNVEYSILTGQIQASQGLVHEQQFCFLSQGAGDKDALLLAA